MWDVVNGVVHELSRGIWVTSQAATQMIAATVCFIETGNSLCWYLVGGLHPPSRRLLPNPAPGDTSRPIHKPQLEIFATSRGTPPTARARYHTTIILSDPSSKECEYICPVRFPTKSLHTALRDELLHRQLSLRFPSVLNSARGAGRRRGTASRCLWYSADILILGDSRGLCGVRRHMVWGRAGRAPTTRLWLAPSISYSIILKELNQPSPTVCMYTSHPPGTKITINRVSCSESVSYTVWERFSVCPLAAHRLSSKAA